MIGKVKRFLGIEGVKVNLKVPSKVRASDGKIEGQVVLTSMHEQTVNYISLRLVEKYRRGRRKSKLVDEFELGSIVIEERYEVAAGEEVLVPFVLPFNLVKSDMDKLADHNPLARGLVGAAKFLKNVKSEYRVEAAAKVQGTALHPFDKKIINIG